MLPRGYDSSIKREQYFPPWLRDEFRKHLDMQPLLFAPGKLSVVMHLRRSDLQRDDSRATPDSYYYKLAKEAWMAKRAVMSPFCCFEFLGSATKSHLNWAKCSATSDNVCMYIYIYLYVLTLYFRIFYDILGGLSLFRRVFMEST